MEKESETQPTSEQKAQVWKSTKYANIVRHVPSGGFYARFRVRGKLLWRSLKTDSITTAQLRLADHLKGERTAAEKLHPKDRAVMTFDQAEAVFFERLDADDTLKPRTKDYYRDRALALKRSWPELGEKKVRSISRQQCEAWGNKFRLGSSPTAFNHTVSFLRRVLKVAIEAGARYGDPTDAIKWKKEERTTFTLPSAEQFLALVDHIHNTGNPHCHQSAEFVRFLAYGGFRKMEAGNVTWEDVDFEKGEIHVRGDAVYKTKNGETRKIPMIGEMRSLLADIRARRRNDPQESKVMEISDVRKSLSNACKAVGAPIITHHDLRHLFATRCIEAGVDIPTVSRWLGHKDGGALAMRVYGHLRDDHSQAMAARVHYKLKESANR